MHEMTASAEAGPGPARRLRRERRLFAQAQFDLLRQSGLTEAEARTVFRSCGAPFVAEVLELAARGQERYPCLALWRVFSDLLMLGGSPGDVRNALDGLGIPPPRVSDVVLYRVMEGAYQLARLQQQRRGMMT